MRPPPPGYVPGGRSYQQLQRGDAPPPGAPGARAPSMWDREVAVLVGRNQFAANSSSGGGVVGGGVAGSSATGVGPRALAPSGPRPDHPAATAKGPDGTSPMQWVDHVQNLYRENMARTRKGVSLTFAPKKPFYQQNPLDYVPILLPKEQQTVWHWVAFVLGLLVLLLLGILATTWFDDVAAGIRDSLVNRARARLDPLPMHGVLRDQMWLKNMSDVPEDTVGLEALMKYVVTAERKGGREDQLWTQTALTLADELVTHGKLVNLLLVGDTFEQWKGTLHGQNCKHLNSDCVSTQLLVEKDLAKVVQENKHMKHGRHMISAIEDETTQNLLWRITEVEGFNETSPTVAVLAVGAADLQLGRNPEEVAAGVRVVLRELQIRMPDTFFLLTGLLPRADDAYVRALNAERAKAGGRRTKDEGGPNLNSVIGAVPYESSQWYHHIFTINRWLLKIADDHTQERRNYPAVYPPVTFVDCGRSLLSPGQRRVGAPPIDEISLYLMPDGRHLSPPGHSAVSGCVMRAVNDLYKVADDDKIKGKDKERAANRAKARRRKYNPIPELIVGAAEDLAPIVMTTDRG